MGRGRQNSVWYQRDRLRWLLREHRRQDSMKALVYTNPRTLELRDWPDPVLEPGEALVRVRAVAVCGSDLHGWLGHSRGRVPPLVLGHEMAGEVVSLRGDVAAFKVGERVAVHPILSCNRCGYCTAGRGYLCRRRQVLGLHVPGGFAEYLKAPIENLYRIPEKMGIVQGALVEPLATALHTVAVADQDCGPMAILGAGPIGLLVLEAARIRGFPTIAVVEVNPNRAGVAQALGADLVVNPNASDALTVLERFFGEDGCTVVVDAAGFSATRRLALGLVRSGGLVIQAGLGEAETPFDFVELIRREVRVVGAYAYSRRDYQTALDWFADHRVKLDRWVSEAPLHEGQALFEELARGDSSKVKVVLRP